MIKTFLNPEGHQNPISGSKVTAFLLKGRILPIGGASAGEGLRLQPAQQACLSCPSGERKKNHVCLVSKQPETIFNLPTRHLRFFGPLVWTPILVWFLNFETNHLDYFRSDKAIFGWTMFPFLE